jgi:ubiquinone biosynthesis protein
MQVTPRHLGRYRQIAEILISHGFGAILAQLDLDPNLNLPQRLLSRQKPPPPDTTAAQHVRLALEELGPTFIKFGQILSTRPDVLPPAYIIELSRLQDQVPPAPWPAVKAYIEQELGDSLERLFASFDPTPLAAASLAQVHAATLSDGRQVVVKVQRPNIEQTINLDLDILYDLARLAQGRTPFGQMYNLVEIADDFAETLRAEMDYRREGRNADRFRANFAREAHVYIPQVHWDYTTARIMVLERISGIKVDDIPALDAAGHDRHQLALHSARLIIQQVLEDGFFHADPHPGNILVMPGEVIGLMDFGTVGYLSLNDRTNLVRLYIVAIQLDAASIVEQLIRMGVAHYNSDRAALQREIQRLLFKYYGLPLQEVQFHELLEEIRPIIYEHHLRLPTALWLLAKTLVMMEGVGKRLYPEFDVFAVSKPYVRRFMRRMLLPSEWGPGALRNVAAWNDLIGHLPGQAHRILNQLEHGELGLQLHISEIQRATGRLDRMANRLILSVLLAALIIALALLIPTLSLAWPWGLLTWVIILSFVVMTILALWLIWSIFRSGGGA